MQESLSLLPELVCLHKGLETDIAYNVKPFSENFGRNEKYKTIHIKIPH